jgi:hypothetical protein
MEKDDLLEGGAACDAFECPIKKAMRSLLKEVKPGVRAEDHNCILVGLVPRPILVCSLTMNIATVP